MGGLLICRDVDDEAASRANFFPVRSQVDDMHLVRAGGIFPYANTYLEEWKRVGCMLL